MPNSKYLGSLARTPLAETISQEKLHNQTKFDRDFTQVGCNLSIRRHQDRNCLVLSRTR